MRHLFVVDSLNKHIQNEKEFILAIAGVGRLLYLCGEYELDLTWFLLLICFAIYVQARDPLPRGVSSCCIRPEFEGFAALSGASEEPHVLKMPGSSGEPGAF